MDRIEYSSRVWREHCKKVAELEKARQNKERGKVKIGWAYIPPEPKITGAVEMHEVDEPSWWVKAMMGFLIAFGFILALLVL